MIRITIEADGYNPVIEEFENIKYSIEQGVDRIETLGSFVDTISPNKQKRITLKAWAGCKDYDSFMNEQEKTNKEVL